MNTINIRNIDWIPVMMNSHYDADPYLINKGNGYINFNRSGADLIMQGVSNTELDFDIDGWSERPASGHQGHAELHDLL